MLASACVGMGEKRLCMSLAQAKAATDKRLHKIDEAITAVIAAGRGHEQRLERLEHDSKESSDGIGTIGRHCQGILAELDQKMRDHVGGTVAGE